MSNPPDSSPYLGRTLLACGITAVVETLVVLSITEPAILLFVLGPLAFLAVIAWRRKAHPERARRIHGVALGIGAFGIAALGIAFFTHPQNADPQKVPLAPTFVPLAQWLVVLYFWISISRQESRENREKQPPSA